MVDFATMLNTELQARWNKHPTPTGGEWVLSDAQGQAVGVVYRDHSEHWCCKAVAPNRYGAKIALNGEILATAVRECESILRDLGWTINDRIPHAVPTPLELGAMS